MHASTGKNDVNLFSFVFVICIVNVITSYLSAALSHASGVSTAETERNEQTNVVAASFVFSVQCVIFLDVHHLVNCP